MERILVVVDVQPGYLQICPPRFLKRIHFRVRKAALEKKKIVFLEMDTNLRGHTVTNLLQLATAEDKPIVITKRYPDGSPELLQTLEANRGSTIFEFCGLYTNACLKYTLESTFKNGYKTELYAEACSGFGRPGLEVNRAECQKLFNSWRQSGVKIHNASDTNFCC